MKRIVFTIFSLLAALSMVSQNSSENSSFTVKDYDGNSYNVVYIGGRLWMKENLRTTHYADGTNANYIHVNHDKANDDTYGLLYDWQTAKGEGRGKQGICPDGWYLPSDWEWQQLEIAAGLEKNEANSMKLYRGEFAAKLCSKDGWKYSYTPSFDMAPDSRQRDRNITGFSVLPAGDGGWVSVTQTAYFWTATEFDKNKAICRKIESHFPMVYRKGAKKESHYSVRCVCGIEDLKAMAETQNEETINSESTAESTDSTDNVEENDFEPANTSDTLAVYDNGYVLHKMWTTSKGKNLVSVVMSEPNEGVYRGFLYLKNVKEATDILSQHSIACQHLAGGYERVDENGKGYIENVVYCNMNEWSTITKTWDCPDWLKISKDEEDADKRLYLIQHQQGLKYYYKTSFTFYKDGTGYQTFTVAPELVAPAAATAYNNGKTGFEYRSGESIRGGYKFTVNGTAKAKFKWERNGYYLNLTYDSNPTVTTSVVVTDKFENVYSANRSQHIAQAKKD